MSAYYGTFQGLEVSTLTVATWFYCQLEGLDVHFGQFRWGSTNTAAICGLWLLTVSFVYEFQTGLDIYSAVVICGH